MHDTVGTVSRVILQAAKRKARGYKAEHFKIIAYLLTGKLDFSKVNSHCLPT